jgi:hypothetical protein
LAARWSFTKIGEAQTKAAVRVITEPNPQRLGRIEAFWHRPDLQAPMATKREALLMHNIFH